jgi:putative peptide zinc metalloprotease protein
MELDQNIAVLAPVADDRAYDDAWPVAHVERVAALAMRRMDTSERGAVYLVEAKNGASMRLSASAFELLSSVRRRETPEAIARRLGPTATEAQVRASVARLLDSMDAIEREADKLRGGFWWRRAVLSEATVTRVASRGARLFRRDLAIGGTIAALALVVAASVAPASEPGMRDHVAGVAVFLLCLLAHEFGHASACARFGVRPRSIGIAAYFIYPVFFTDVTAAWSLPRAQRVVVDLGGVYFEILAAGVCALAFFATAWPPLQVVSRIALGSVLFSLNPILKFDGYWVIADALGVTNLAGTARRIGARLLDRLRGIESARLPWSAPTIAFLSVYAIASVAFNVMFLRSLVEVTVPIVVHLPGRVAEFCVALAPARPWPTLHQTAELLGSLYVAVFVLAMARITVLRLLPRARSRRAAFDQRHGQRHGVRR